ncbi:MAG: exo-alpha-sialidase [Candidatus Hydrogenedentes bacterium]|nr:exo-alpha-sialidase [Candidatus Hydrogenedentota bacterium]
MRMSSIFLAAVPLALSIPGGSAPAAEEALWLHPKVAPLPTETMGPFVRLPDNRILAVDSHNVLSSGDEGQTWESWPLETGMDFEVSNERALLVTREGALILACMNLKERVWKWNSAIHDADPGTTLPTYALRSLDFGKTWETPQKLHDEWSGCVRNMIQTRDGAIVFTAMRLLNRPGRHSVLTYTSRDNGVSWKPSNVVDLGGRGHHGGATEATVLELNDGRLWKLIRTNLGRFWQAWSDDSVYWRTIAPSDIPASSAPGQLLRLASGRVMLVWNRPFPDGETSFPLRGGDNEWSEVPVSNHRWEVSLAFSEDDGATWTDPAVLAKRKDASLAYPYLFERAPGEIWLTTMQGGIRIAFRESDFVE